ncbi:MAG: Gfo/Idh/MocA family oxidoreductase [Bacteroidetes bacterium]|nr:Gfo/Idh/MocA family oxidoreductase [Bacteroidota bacterium]MBS1973264.1 Gfo/Idh/MocA family oxidoreductase [Bacteroidota bacterium]
MSRIVKFSIIGCGRIAQRHAEHISKQGKLVSVCDVAPGKAKTLADKFGAVDFTDIDKLLNHHDRPDVVAVCTPNGLHAAHSIKALRAGHHVLCEKPMALTVQDCGAMINAAEHANKRLFIVKQNRFNPPVAAVKKIIEEGRLGKIYSAQLNCFWNRNNEYYQHSWKGTKDLDGGTLFTQFSHFIDLLYWMIGDVKEVNGYIGNYHHEGIIEFEDTGTVSLKFYNGAIGTINYTVNSFQKNMEGSLTVFGEKGTVKIGGQYLNELEYQQIENYKIENLPPGNPPNHYGQYQGSMSNHDKVYQNVIEVLNGNGIIATNGFEGLKTVEIIDRIYSAAKKS